MVSQLKPEVHRRLEAAVLEIFSHSDFHKANIRDIAKKAGVSFSTIYKHYQSKENLVFSFVDIWLGELTERLIDHLNGIENLKEKMRKVLWLQLDYYEKNPGLGRILFMTMPMKTWMADDTFRQKKMINLFLTVLRKGQKEGTLNPLVPTWMLLDLILGMVQRLFFMWISRGEKGKLSDMTQPAFELLWRAISKP